MQRIKEFVLNPWTQFLVAVMSCVSFVSLVVFLAVRPGPIPPGPDPVEPDRDNPVILPKVISTSPGKMFRLEAKSLRPVQWVITPGIKADCQEAGQGLFIVPHQEGDFYVGCYCSVGWNGVSPVFWTRVISGKGPLPPPPGPGPLPPGPNPPKPPEPPGPSPIPLDGLRVMIVYEKADLTKLPPAQLQVMYSKEIWDFLERECAIGSDGKTREFRIWDKDTETSGAEKHWQEAMKRDRKSLPWLLVSNPRKGGGYEGPLPASVEEMKAVLSKFKE